MNHDEIVKKLDSIKPPSPQRKQPIWRIRYFGYVLVILCTVSFVISAGVGDFFYHVNSNIEVDTLLFIEGTPGEEITENWNIQGVAGDRFNQSIDIEINTASQRDTIPVFLNAEPSDTNISAYWSTTPYGTEITNYDVSKSTTTLFLNVELPTGLLSGNYSVNWSVSP